MNNGYSICLNKWALDKDIKNELGLLLIISSLCAEKGYCWATNEYLAELFGITEVSVSSKIKKLEEKDYIEVTYEKRGCEITKRELRLKNILTDDSKNFYSTIKKNFKDNNINTNNTIINKEKNIIKKEEKSKRFVKPTIEEIKAYCEERNNGIDAESFYYHYESIDWYVGNHRMTNWKSCIITWEKRNKARKQVQIKEDTSDIIRRMREESNHGAR